jgi:predicted DNA-binding transcriptional regulator YafY
MDTLLRQWTMLRMIPRLPGKIDTTTIARRLEEDEGFRVHVRTIQRDLDTLSGIFQIVSDEKKPAGWSWTREAPVLDIPGMDPLTALAFKMAGVFLDRMLPPACLGHLGPHFRQADRILETMSEKGPAVWAKKIAAISRHFPLRPPAVDPDVAAAVYGALFRGRRFTATYLRRGETRPVEREVNPLGLVFADQVVYLVCTLWTYDDVLHLALHRIRSAAILPEPARTPRGFTLKDYVASGVFGYPVTRGTMRLRVLFDKGTAYHLQETPLATDQKMTAKEEGVLVEATVPDSAQLRWWLLGFGDQVEVLGPAALRKEMAAVTSRSAARYRTRVR